MAQDAVDRWWWPSLMMFGPPDDDSPNSAQSMAWGIKRFSNDELRQTVRRHVRPAGRGARPDAARPGPAWNDERGHYDFGAIDWAEFYEVLKGDGPCNAQRIEHRRHARTRTGAWVREAAAAYAAKQRRQRRGAA